jgi:hypothetical protein
MSMRLRELFVAGAILCVPAVNYAKPPDLPADLGVNFAGDEPATPIERPADQPQNRATTAAPIDMKYVVDLFRRAEQDRAAGNLRLARARYQEVHLLAPMSPEGQAAIQRLRVLESPTNDFSEEQEPPLERTTMRPNIPRRGLLPTWFPTFDEFLRTLEMQRSTQQLGTAPIRNNSH